MPATPVAYGLLCCSFRCQGILPGAETIRGRVGKEWAHRQQGDCPWGTRYCLQCRKEIVCNDPCDQDRAHAAFQAHTSKVGEISGFRMQRRCVSRNQKTIGNTHAKHGTMCCWCLRMKEAMKLATIIEQIHCILSAPLCISTTLCQSEEVHLLLYLL